MLQIEFAHAQHTNSQHIHSPSPPHRSIPKTPTQPNKKRNMGHNQERKGRNKLKKKTKKKIV